MREKPLDQAVVAFCSEIESQLTWVRRAGESDDYRRGYREALTGLKNSMQMMDVLDALKALGWQAPRMYWSAPPPLSAATDDDDDGGKAADA